MTSAHFSWLPDLLRLLLPLLVALVIGLLLDAPWMALSVALLLVVAWQHWQLYQHVQHLSTRKYLQAPTRKGAWGQVDALFAKQQTATRARRQRLLSMLRAYRAVSAILPDAIVLIDRNTQRILWFNEAATPLLGLHASQHRHRPVVEALKPLPVAQWLTGGRNAEPMQDVASPVNSHMRLNLRLLPYSDELWLLLARDMSQLLQLQDMRRDFVANVSHELRSPLTVIHGYLELFDTDAHPEWAAALFEMRHQSQRMRQLVDDLLTLSRLEAGVTLHNEPIAMATLLGELKREAEALSQGQHRIEVHDDAAVDLFGARNELRSAFSNLVGNAIRYTPVDGAIHIRLHTTQDGTGVLSVSDTGIGIPHDHLPRLTERFYRVSSSRSRSSGGTGLGLAIVKHVLSLHDATLHIQSTPNQGSCFSCHFAPTRVLPRHADSPLETKP